MTRDQLTTALNVLDVEFDMSPGNSRTKTCASFLVEGQYFDGTIEFVDEIVVLFDNDKNVKACLDMDKISAVEPLAA